MAEIVEFYKNRTLDPDFNSSTYVLNHRLREVVTRYLLPHARQKGLSDAQRYYFHYCKYAFHRLSNDILSFYTKNKLDRKFDEKEYLDKHPEAKSFLKKFCDQNDIDDRHRLYYHQHFFNNKEGLRFQNFNIDISKFQDVNKSSIDELVPPHENFKRQYNRYVKKGKEISADSKIAFVALARNCEKQLQTSINSIRKIKCKTSKVFIFENDSDDDTKEILIKNKTKHKNIEVKSTTKERPYLQDMSTERTKHLSEYRNICLRWVKNNCKDFDYVVVVDLDADLGFSINGIYNTIGWFDSLDNAGGIGSYSLLLNSDVGLVHYDSFASRLNDWEPNIEKDRQRLWFNQLHPLVGSEPFCLYSCFGGLMVYTKEAFVSGIYSEKLGCEHVYFHKKLHEKGYKIYLNPSSRFFSVYERRK